MGRLIKNIRSTVRPVSFFFPFTYYFFLFTIAVLIADSWLTSRELTPQNSFSDIFLLLLKTGFLFLISLLSVGLISVLVSYFVFLVKKKRNNITFSITSTGITGSINPAQKIHISVAPVWKPFLGFIKLRLKYDGNSYSDKFSLAESRHRKLIPVEYQGDYTWSLPEIKEYQIEKLILYFEDLFQFFSLTVALPMQTRFHTHPFRKDVEDIAISPRKTEETKTRIEELKRVEGEHLHYKNFENSDDVRRIVWKIYAKNKDLVVRVPEILDPYASHAYMYASFFSSFDIAGNASAEIIFLNYYKSVVWSIYQRLGKEGLDVRYVADQQTPVRQFDEEQQSVQYTITTSGWQREEDIKSFVRTKDASIVILSSLCSAEEAETVFNQRAPGTVFVLVCLSRSLHHSYLGSLLQWIFVKQQKNDTERYKTGWRLSLLRPKVLQNEKKLEAIFSKHDKVLVI